MVGRGERQVNDSTTLQISQNGRKIARLQCLLVTSGNGSAALEALTAAAMRFFGNGKPAEADKSIDAGKLLPKTEEKVANEAPSNQRPSSTETGS